MLDNDEIHKLWQRLEEAMIEEEEDKEDVVDEEEEFKDDDDSERRKISLNCLIAIMIDLYNVAFYI